MYPTPKVMFQIALAIGASVLALLIPLHFATSQQSIAFVKHYSYWALWISILLFFYFLLKSLPLRSSHEWKLKIKRHSLGAIVIMVASGYLHLHTEPSFKILNDEHVLSSTAKSMYLDHTSYVKVSTHVVNDRNIANIGFVDKRPGFFPFTLSIVHSLTGYRPQNVFWLNSGLTLLLFALVYFSISRIAGKSHGILAVLLLTSLPLLAQNTNGGGYEIMNLCLISALSIAGVNYMRQSGKQGLDLLLMTSILLANNRYESIVYVTVPALLFLIKSYREKSISLTWFSVCSPLLLMVPLFSYDVFQSSSLFIQTSDENFFSFSHLSGNLAHALAYLFEPEAIYSNSLLLSVGGIIACLFLAVQLVRRCAFFLKTDHGLTVLFSIFLVVAFNTTLALSCYWGEWTDPATSRFSLPLQLFFALSIPLMLKYDFKLATPPAWMLVGVILFVLSFTGSHTAALNKQVPLENAYASSLLLDWIERQPEEESNLYVSTQSIGVALYDHASIPTHVANAMPERVTWTSNASIYNNVYAAEMLFHDGKHVYPATEISLSSRFVTETVFQELINLNLMLRIVKIVGLNAAEPGQETLPRNMPLAEPGLDASAQEMEKYLYDSLPLAPAGH